MDLNFQVSWECRLYWVVSGVGVVVIVSDGFVVGDVVDFLRTKVTQGLDFGEN